MDANTQKLAERIAVILREESETEKPKNDFSALTSTLEKINQRLDTIELQLTTQKTKSQIPNLQAVHFSQEKFTSLEEIADEIIDSLQNEKACPYEPAGKPCDHCAMCNSRGF
jgi:hypothetical protein